MGGWAAAARPRCTCSSRRPLSCPHRRSSSPNARRPGRPAGTAPLVKTQRSETRRLQVVALCLEVGVVNPVRRPLTAFLRRPRAAEPRLTRLRVRELPGREVVPEGKPPVMFGVVDTYCGSLRAKVCPLTLSCLLATAGVRRAMVAECCWTHSSLRGPSPAAARGRASSCAACRCARSPP